MLKCRVPFGSPGEEVASFAWLFFVHSNLSPSASPLQASRTARARRFPAPPCGVCTCSTSCATAWCWPEPRTVRCASGATLRTPTRSSSPRLGRPSWCPPLASWDARRPTVSTCAAGCCTPPAGASLVASIAGISKRRHVLRSSASAMASAPTQVRLDRRERREGYGRREEEGSVGRRPRCPAEKSRIARSVCTLMGWLAPGALFLALGRTELGFCGARPASTFPLLPARRFAPGTIAFCVRFLSIFCFLHASPRIRITPPFLSLSFPRLCLSRRPPGAPCGVSVVVALGRIGHRRHSVAV